MGEAIAITSGKGGVGKSSVALNIGMVLGIAPVIGIPLPFFSAGGTSGMCLFAAIGLVLSVSYHNSTKYRMFYTEKD